MYPSIEVVLPEWVLEVARPDAVYESREARVEVAVELARQNVARDLGGPFGAAIFEAETGRLVGPGVNLVEQLGNSSLHAEVVAIMVAEKRLDSFTLAGQGMPEHELVTSCEPCAMCLGAVLWSGVSRVIWSASGEDARAIGFDEGPVFEASHEYLEARGIELVGDVLHDEGRNVLRFYVDRGGRIYNPR